MVFRFIVAYICLGFSIQSIGQIDPIQQEEAVLNIVEEMPEFPGGQVALLEFIRVNIQYPKTAMNDSVQGKVFVEFIIEKDGSVSNVTTIRGVRSDLDLEAMRVIKMMPKWKPGTQDGKPVRVKYRIPIYFKLD